MSKKARDLKLKLETHFDCAIYQMDNSLKFHLKELQGPDIAVLAGMDNNIIQSIKIIRSGTGLTVIITV
jgi:hypothetical protein